MSFCHECGSELSEAEAYCPVCGIALRNPVLEEVQEKEPEETRQDDVPAQEEPAPAADEQPEPSAASEPDRGEADTTPESVPEDEFVDISALRSSDIEEGTPEPKPAEPVGETPLATEEPPDEGQGAEAATEGPVEPQRSSVPEPPAPGILGSQLEPAEESVPSQDSPASAGETPDSPSTTVTPVDEVIQTPLPSDLKEPVAEAVSEPSEEEAAIEASGESRGMAEIEVDVPAAGEPEEQVADAPEASPASGPAGEEDAEAAASSEVPAVTEEQESIEAPAPEEETAEAEEEASAGEEEEDFREGATLIAAPYPDKEVSAAKRAASDLESPTADDVEVATDEEQPADEKIEAAEPGAEAPDQVPAAESRPAEPPAGASDEGEEGPSTTPNIGGGDTDGSKAPKLKPLSEGTVLNSRYEIVRKIGGGGMGAVYLASDKNLGGVLRAVKEMVQSYIEEDQQEKAVQDFKRESMLLTSLEHPSIPTIYDYFFDDDAHRFYLVMKYISGGDLAARLRSAPEGKLEELEVVEWAIQIADVLDYLHNRQPPIVYRDLKPANIMLDGNSGKVMLIDFGIARWINKEEKGVTAVGTMGYAPPELFSGNVVPSSDIYSLGSTVFHLLTGADPQNNPLLIFDFEKNPKPRQINPRLSDQMESILMRAVEYNAEKRFSTAGEMRSALTDHLSNLNSGNVTYGKTESPKSVGFSDQSVFCGFCGQKIVATDMFCAFCGAKQPLAQPGVHSAGYVPVKLTAKLIIEGTSQLDYPSFELAKDENLVGRRDPMSNIFPEVDLSKFDPQTKISRKHARIWRDGERYMLEDLGSSNGTLLIPSSNETVRLAPHQAQELAHGDRIKLGDTMLHFVISA
ncbi:MAG: protein kinase [Aridibacter famidurans]|nr:protein kinase [Aridibacter famidurans]